MLTTLVLPLVFIKLCEMIYVWWKLCYGEKSAKERLYNLFNAEIGYYIDQLVEDKTSEFGAYLDDFISNVKDSTKNQPQVLMRNMRECMDWLKNYLATSGENNVDRIIQEKTSKKTKLISNQDINRILETILYKHVVAPLRYDLYEMIFDGHVRDGSLELLIEKMNFARTKPLDYFGILKPDFTPPNEAALEEISSSLKNIKRMKSPLGKIKKLLASIRKIHDAVADVNKSKIVGADEFLPVLVWVLVQTGVSELEIEADYIWGLLDSVYQTGEEGYYLTSLSCALHVIKNFEET